MQVRQQVFDLWNQEDSGQEEKEVRNAVIPDSLVLLRAADLLRLDSARCYKEKSCKQEQKNWPFIPISVQVSYLTLFTFARKQSVAGTW